MRTRSSETARSRVLGCDFAYGGVASRWGDFCNVGFDVFLFLNPRSPAMNASSMCGINVTASTDSP